MNNTFSNTFAPPATAPTLHKGATDAVQRREFIVGSLDDKGQFSFSATPAFHKNETLALLECERLAKLNPGKAYIAVRLSGGRLVPRVIGTVNF